MFMLVYEQRREGGRKCKYLNLISKFSGTGSTIFFNFRCVGNNETFPELEEREHALKDARLSFPSGHASFSFQTSVFIVLYLQVRESQ